MAPVMNVEQIDERIEEIRARLQEIDAEYAGKRFSPEVKEEWNELNAERDELRELKKELETRAARISELADKEGAREDGASFGVHRKRSPADVYDLSEVRASIAHPEEAARELKERAKRAIELAEVVVPDGAGVTEDRAKANIERTLRKDAPDSRFARYLLATGSPAYKRAFAKTLSAQMRGSLPSLTAEEQSAAQQVLFAERALSLTGSAGGFAVPFELDPTILNTSNGVVNPIRQIARVINVTVDEWRGVSSTGVTASYAAEATETTDNAPTLAQPTISTEKAQAFIPFSIEVDMDWPSMREQMGELLQDAKDTLEAAKFITGTGTDEPFGVAVGTTNTVNAGAGGTFTLANLYALIQALPPRYRPRASWIGDLIILNSIRRFDTVGSSASIWIDSLADETPASGLLLGKRAYEASEMPDVTTVGVKFLIIGDFSRYVIVDRIGLNVEVIPHLFGANRRPTGQRGLYAYWRNGAKVVDANAFRALLGVA